MGRLLALAAVVLLTGCVADSATVALFVAARDPNLVARNAAHEWDPKAALVRVHGVEPAEPAAELPGLADRVDGTRGDGRAQAWEYLFSATQSPDAAQDLFLVVVGANGAVINKGPVGEASGHGAPIAGAPPLADWNLDSKDVAPIVRRFAPDWDAGAAKAQIVHWYLFGTEGKQDPHWLMGYELEGRGRSFLVNARNGSIAPLDLANLFGAASLPRWEGGKQNALLTPQETTIRFPLRVEASHHPSLIAGMKVERTTTGTVNLTLQRDNVALAWAEWRQSDVPGVKKTSIAWPANATFEIVARLTSLTPQPVELFWCATGLPSGTLRDHACRL